MDIRQQIIGLDKEQNKKLQAFRKKRGFCAKTYIRAKSLLLDKYMRSSNLDTCVVGISGGIDSAIVLGLLANTANLGQIKKIIPVTIPNETSKGVTNQMASELKAEILCDAFGYSLYNVSIDKAVKETNSTVLKSFNINEITNWAEGQLTPQIRTICLAHVATVLRDKGDRPIIVGTTNRDEGAYLGYVGKYSDGMVDIQLISDLHKSEVYQVAKELKIPSIIIGSKPSGDMFDGACDEEVFGTTYDAVELHLNEKIQGEAGEHLENLHKYNSHKYLVGSPAVHLDILESGVEGGWDIQFSSKYWKELEKQGDIIKPNFVAPMNFTKIFFDKEKNAKSYSSDHGIYEIENVLSDDEIEQLVTAFRNSKTKEANVFGYTNEQTEQKGSHRATLYNVEMAKVIWNRIADIFPSFQIAEVPNTDWEKGEIYVPLGVSPLMRYIGYEEGGSLVPHYDYAYCEDDKKTLYSVVIYLTDNEKGATRFLRDEQSESWEKDLKDWLPENKGDAEVIKEVLPKAGNILIFPHHLLHDSDFVDSEKIIIRTDIVCQKIKHS